MSSEEKKEVLEEGKVEEITPARGRKIRNNKVIVCLIVGIVIIICTIFVVYILYNNDKSTISNDKKEVKSKYRMNGNDIQDFDLVFLQLESNKQNQIYSPLSIKYALAMLQEGAEGDSYDQINAVVGDYKSKKYTNSEHLSLANSLFIREKYKEAINEKYVSTLKEKYDAEIFYDKFENANNMNNWVSDKTFKLVKDLVKDTDVQNEDAISVLINALAIDMDWNYRLQHNDTDSKVPTKLYNVNYPHIDYSDYIPIIYNNKYQKIKFNDSEEVEIAEIGASINNYDIFKEEGEDNIRTTVTNEYKKYLSEGGYPCSEGNNDEEKVKDYVDRYMDEIGKNYKSVDDSTDFMFYADDSVKVFAKDLKSYDNTTLQYVGIMPIDEALEDYVKNVNAKKVSDLIDKLKTISLENFDYGKVYQIKGSIPFFKYEYSLDLKGDLLKLGIKDVFSPTDSKLGKMANNGNGANFFITDANHKANIEFSNDGIKAAASTEIGGGLGATACGFDHLYKVPVEKIDLTFNKPYIYIIRDKDTGEVWFTGQVYNPSNK